MSKLEGISHMVINAEATTTHISLRDGMIPCHCTEPNNDCGGKVFKKGCECCDYKGEVRPEVTTTIKYDGSRIVLKREVAANDKGEWFKSETLTLACEEFHGAFAQIAPLLGWKRDGI